MADAKPSPRPREEQARTCNLPHCEETKDLKRGLCPVHDSTHRGLADPDPVAEEFAAEQKDRPNPEVALP